MTGEHASPFELFRLLSAALMDELLPVGSEDEAAEHLKRLGAFPNARATASKSIARGLIEAAATRLRARTIAQQVHKEPRN